MNTNKPRIPLYSEDIETAYDKVKESYPLAVAKKVNDYEIVFHNGETEVAFLSKDGRNPVISWFRDREEKKQTKAQLKKS